MRTFILITFFSLITLSTFAQQVNTAETITLSTAEEVKNPEGVYSFLDKIEQQNQELKEMKKQSMNAQKEIEADENWKQKETKTAQHAENQEIIEACVQMLATNKRMMEGKITIRSVDAQKNLN